MELVVVVVVVFVVWAEEVGDVDVTVVGGAASLRLQPLLAMSSLGQVVFLNVTSGLSAPLNQSKRK